MLTTAKKVCGSMQRFLKTNFQKPADVSAPGTEPGDHLFAVRFKRVLVKSPNFISVKHSLKEATVTSDNPDSFSPPCKSRLSAYLKSKR